jgi:hypothetical protein
MQYRTSRQSRTSLENIQHARRPARQTMPADEALYLVRRPGMTMGQPIWASSADQACNRYRLMFNLPTSTELVTSNPGR